MLKMSTGKGINQEPNLQKRRFTLYMKKTPYLGDKQQAGRLCCKSPSLEVCTNRLDQHLSHVDGFCPGAGPELDVLWRSLQCSHSMQQQTSALKQLWDQQNTSDSFLPVQDRPEDLQISSVPCVYLRAIQAKFLSLYFITEHSQDRRQAVLLNHSRESTSRC